MVTIPVVRNMSADIEDLQGQLKIPQSLADQLSALMDGGIEIRLSACLERRSTDLRFVRVSFSPVPVQSSKRNKASQIARLKKELAATREAFDETLQDIYDNTPNPDGVERPDPKMVVATKIDMKLGRCRPIEEVIEELRGGSSTGRAADS